MTSTIATAMFAVVALLRGQLKQADRFSNEAVGLADKSPGRQGNRYPVQAPRAFTLVELDRLDEARTMLDTGTRLSEELGTAWHLPSYQMVRAVERFTAGEWDDAVVEVEASLDLAGETGETYSLILAGSVLSLICLHRNDLARAAQVSEAANRQLVQTGARYRSQWSLLARALIMEAEGKPDDALAGLTECWDLCTRLDLALEYRVLGPDLVRLGTCGGRHRAGP